MSKLTTVAFKCNESDHERLKQRAAKAGCTVSAFVHGLVSTAINDDGQVSSAQTTTSTLSDATQHRMAEGVFLLCSLSRLLFDGKNMNPSVFDEAEKRALEILEETQSRYVD